MTAITKLGADALVPRNFDEAARFADMVARSDLAPKDYKGKPGNVLIAMQMGAEVGLAPMQAIQNIAVINGRPSLWGDALLALVQSQPDCRDVVETFDERTMTATCTITRGERTPVTRTFSQADAQKAGLWGKTGPWQQYPKRMLQMRARAFAARDSYADVLKGLQSAEEMGDVPPQEIRATVREVPRPETARSKSEPPPALPQQTSGVIDMPSELDPADYVMKSGTNVGKRLGDLPGPSLHWYAEEFKPRNDEGVLVKKYARQVLDDRKAKAESERKSRQESVEGDGDAWGLGGNEAEAEAMASANDE